MKAILTVLMTTLFSAVLAISLLLTIPKLRHGVFLFSLELPGYITKFLVEQYIPVRRFDKAVPWLERELKLVNWFAPPQNKLLPGLIKNAEYAVEHARFPSDFLILQPFLKKLVNSHPQLYPARIWLAQALANVDPHLSLEQLEEAVKLSPTGSKPFRIAINLALRNKMGEELDEWCSRYKNAHFGAFQPKSSSTLSTDGIGLRRVTLEVLSDSGDRLFITNMGLQLDKSKTYYFSLTKSTLAKELRVHLAIVSGISVDLKKIRTYKSGELKNSFDLGKDLPMTSWGGFFLKNGHFLSTSQKGGIISIFSPSSDGSGFGETDQIRIDLEFKKLGIANPTPCGQNSTNK